MTRIVHTADTHVGYQQYHSPERREDFRRAFESVIDDAVADDADAVVHAGDLFHDRRPGLVDIQGVIRALRRLDDAGIPFLAVVGNHETKRDAQWLDLFEDLGLATRLGREPVVVGNTAFYGLDFVPRSRRDDLDYAFDPHDADVDTDADTDADTDVDHAALVAHGLFAPLAPDYTNDPWDAREVLDEATVDFDAMLLGDDHAPKREQFDDGTWVTYSGSTERASAAEREDRGYNIVEFGGGGDGRDDGGSVRITRRGLPTREFVFVDVELAEGEGLSRVQERVGQHDLDDAVVVVTIEGEGEDDGGGEPVAPAHVEEYITEGGALVARVTDRREAAQEGDIEVSFADPDEAVRERVRDLGLSPAARGLDETIRESEVAKTNVADAVEERVREVLDEGDSTAFEPAPAEPDPETEAETAAERIADDGDGEAPEEGPEDRPDGTTADETATANEADGSDGQASVEDYL